MPLPQFLIGQVDIRVQWSGMPDAFYSSGSPQGFPGVRVPNSLVSVLRSLEGTGFPIDPGQPVFEEWNRHIQARFALASQGAGPAPGYEWTLLGVGDPTTSGQFKWHGAAANALAYQIGKRIGGDETEFVEDLGDGNGVGTSRLWVSITVEPI